MIMYEESQISGKGTLFVPNSVIFGCSRNFAYEKFNAYIRNAGIVAVENQYEVKGGFIVQGPINPCFLPEK